MTPWMLVLLMVAAVVTLLSRSTRLRAVVLLASASVAWMVITLSPQKFDRYVLLVWPAFALLAGLVIELVFARARWREDPAARGALAVGGVTFVVVASLLVAPSGSVYSNPLLGGADVAQQAINLGGSTREAGVAIEEREGEECARRRILTDRPRRLYFPCGVLKPIYLRETLERGDYAVVTRQMRTRDPEIVRELVRHARLVERVEDRGVHVADILQMTRALPPEPQA
jgi:hypothetical protein